MIPKILFVDDDVNLLEAVQRSLRKQFSIETAVGGAAGLRKLADKEAYSVVVADMQMPDMTGLEFLRQVQVAAPHAVRMMLTGNSDLKTAMDAVNDGRVFRFLTKPCPPMIMAPALEAGLEQYRLLRAERELLENTLGGAVKVLTEILSLTDPTTYARSQKLKEYVHEFIPTTQGTISWELELAASLSQVGRVTVPPAVLDKLRDGIPLSSPEQDLASRVPEFGGRLLENIPRLENVAQLVRYQNKCFDGTGLPADAVAGQSIPIGARILKVLHDLIELEAQGFSRHEAFAQMQERTGWYDPKVLTAVSHWCDVALNLPSRTIRQLVKISDMQVGQVLAEDLRTPGGLLILGAKTRLTDMLLVKLRNFRTLNEIDRTLSVYTDDATGSGEGA